jgi:hypothetical protein
MNARHYTQAEIEKVLALDEKRTPGEYEAVQFCKASATAKSKAIDSWKIRPVQHRVLGSLDKDDAHFLAAAPKMAAIIRQQQQEIAHLKELLDIAHHNARIT